MVNNEIIKLKFDNSFNGRLFAVQGDTGRVFNLQVFDDFSKPVDVTGMKLRMYVANSKEVSYSEGEIVTATEGKIKVQVYNSQLKYPGKQKAQFILTDKDGQKIGSKIFDLWIEEGLEAGPTVGKNIYVDFEKINEALELLKDYDKTLEEAKEVDASLKVGINEGIEARNNLADCKKKALEIKGQLDNSKVDANKTLENLNTTKTESETLKSDLTSENQKATENIKDLTNKIETGKTTTSELNQSIENAKTNKSNLDKSNTTALSTKKSLEDATTTANTTKTELGNLKNQGDTLSGDLTTKITDGNKLKSNLDASISKAENAKSNLNASVGIATSTNTTLKATDTQAKKTEALIKDLMSQLNFAKDEVSKIVAAGDLSKYVTDPKLQEALKSYATKDDLSKIDVTSQLKDYAKKTDVPTKLSQLEEDITHRLVTDEEKEKWNKKFGKKEVNDLIDKRVKEESRNPKPKIMTAVIDQANSNPLTCVTYEDDAKTMGKGSSEWDDFFGTKLVLFKDGKEVRDLQDSELNNLKPEDGDVMVKFKRMGLNIKTVGDKVYVSMTNDPDDPNFRYYAHTRGTERREAFYLGAYLGYEENEKLRSIKGFEPTGEKTIADFRKIAQANGTGYEQIAFYQLTFLQAMYVLKYGNLDSQTALGKGLVDDGPHKETGGTNNKGINYGTQNGTDQMRFQYLEDFWGNKVQFIDGVVNKHVVNDGNYKPTLIIRTEQFENNGSFGKEYEVNSLDGYISKVHGSNELGFTPKEGAGSETIYYCDIGCINSVEENFAYFGGFVGDWSFSGAFCLYFGIGASYADSDFGARLMYL